MPYKIFGCKVNKFYINKRLTYYEDKQDTFLIATCVVTDRAKNKRLKETLKALKTWMKIAITGCGTLEKGKLISESDFFSIYPELIPYKENIELLGEAPTSRHCEEWGKTLAKPNNMANQIKNNHSLYTKHFLMIQNGCDNHCSFCLTVKKRGPHQSRPLNDIITEIQQIEAQGGKEIVLTGINLAARGCTNTRNPIETQFPELLETILRETTIPRIRISSIGPEYTNDHFFEIAQDKRILPHFHYSIQSFSDNVLKGMRRNYDTKLLKTILQKTKKLNRPQAELISIWADLIVGFPGESEADFLETLEGIKTYNITKLHAFPFSDHHKRETIPASLYPNQVPQEIKKEREARLLEVWEQIRNDFIAKNKGTTHEVLIEEIATWSRRYGQHPDPSGKKEGKWKGRTENYIQVELEGDHKKGEIISYTFD